MQGLPGTKCKAIVYKLFVLFVLLLLLVLLLLFELFEFPVFVVELEELVFPGSPGPPVEISDTRDESSPGPAAKAGRELPRLVIPIIPASASARHRFMILSALFMPVLLKKGMSFS